MTGPAVHRFRSRPHRLELPTVLLAVAIHGGWLALTWWWSALPVVVLAALGAWITAWHGSLQHEAVHGHPTGRRAIDALIAGAPFWLWLPFPRYRESHLTHHATGRLTDPTDDPESYYVDHDAWLAMSSAQRLLHRAMQTVVGRLLFGPAVVIARFAAAEARDLAAGRGGRRRVAMWLVHAAACAAVLVWVIGVCGMPLLTYVACFVYPGLSLTLLRSFTEHRPAPRQAERTAVVEAGFLFSLLYLHNNLHSLHHSSPGVAWYRLPALYRRKREALLRANGGFHFAGYGEVMMRYGLAMKDEPVRPMSVSTDRTASATGDA